MANSDYGHGNDPVFDSVHDTIDATTNPVEVFGAAEFLGTPGPRITGQRINAASDSNLIGGGKGIEVTLRATSE